jgi:phosphoribosylglycinamide formyltransferase-1
MAKKRLGVLISGSGSNLQALIDACAAPDFPAEIALVISNKADAFGLERAQNAGITTKVLNHRDYADRVAFDRALTASLQDAGVDLVCLAGFLRLVTPEFVETWHNRLINIHPSLLPSFKGLHAPAQALAAGVKIAGCTVHFVRAEMDSGPIIAQAAVPVLANDTADTLAARILTQEHLLYPLAVQLWAEGKLVWEEDRLVNVAQQSVSQTLLHA